MSIRQLITVICGALLAASMFAGSANAAACGISSDCGARPTDAVHDNAPKEAPSDVRDGSGSGRSGDGGTRRQAPTTGTQGVNREGTEVTNGYGR